MFAALRRSGACGGLGRACGGSKTGSGAETRPPYWFPRWDGETVAILGAGPSIDKGQAQKVRHLKRIVINCSWLLAPDADALYGCDGKWWRCQDEGYGRHALCAFAGLKITQDGGAASQLGLRRVNLDGHTISTRAGTIGAGGNSGFQALNLAIQFGARRIILLGYDMRGSGHWHGPHKTGTDPNNRSAANWRRIFAESAPKIARLGVEVINATPRSALTCFARATLSDVV